ncbi:MAG TPA: CcdB family protein [Kofleriaceae bacterium]
MAQFDVYQNTRNSTYPLPVDIQADVFAKLKSRLSVPLTPRPRHDQQITPLTPIVVINSQEYIFITALATAILKAELKTPVASLADQRSRLVAAFDLLITGS